MHYSHNYLDPQAKSSAVRENIQAMIMRSWEGNVGMHFESDSQATKAIIRDWIFANPNATITELSDFTSRLIEDYKERND